MQRAQRTNENMRQLNATGAKRGKTRDHDVIGFGFSSDWVSRWRELFEPITKRNKKKKKYMSGYEIDKSVKKISRQFLIQSEVKSKRVLVRTCFRALRAGDMY